MGVDTGMPIANFDANGVFYDIRSEYLKMPDDVKATKAVDFLTSIRLDPDEIESLSHEIRMRNAFHCRITGTEGVIRDLIILKRKSDNEIIMHDLIKNTDCTIEGTSISKMVRVLPEYSSNEIPDGYENITSDDWLRLLIRVKSEEEQKLQHELSDRHTLPAGFAPIEYIHHGGNNGIEYIDIGIHPPIDKKEE